VFTEHIQYLTFLPLPFVPAFISGMHPKAALDRAKEILLLLPPAEQLRLEYILIYLRAACHKNAGLNAESKMLVPFANGGRNPEFVNWCIQQIRAYYPGGAQNTQFPGGGQPAQGPIDFNAFGASLTNGLSTGMAAAILVAQQLATPLQATKAKEGWTALEQEQILKVMGRAANEDFLATVPSIWQEFIAEGKTADAVERVLRGRFRVDADDPDAPDVTPYISRRSALDIIAGRFAPQELTMEGVIHGIMPLAFVPRSGWEQHDANQDDEDEDRATFITTETPAG
jgi:hypothetical protein